MPTKGRPPKPDICLECDKPRMKGAKTRYWRCEEHQRALWRSHPTGRPSRDRKRAAKNTPNNDVLFRRQNSSPQSFTTERSPNNRGNGIEMNLRRFNPARESSQHPLAVELRSLNSKVPTPQCYGHVEISVQPDPAMLKRARIARIARDDPNPNDDPMDVAESGWKAKAWTEGLRERFA